MAITLQLKGGTSDKWQQLNPTLAEREVGLIYSTLDGVTGFKIGDGTTPWNELNEFIPGEHLINELSENITSTANDISFLSGAITAETTRAKAAEDRIANNLSTSLSKAGISTADNISIAALNDDDIATFVIKLSDNVIKLCDAVTDANIASTNAIIIGNDITESNNSNSNVIIGNDTYASHVVNSTLIGTGASAENVNNAVQLGNGKNVYSNSLQFQDQPIIKTENDVKVIDESLLKRSLDNKILDKTTVRAAQRADFATEAQTVRTVSESIKTIINNIVTNKINDLNIVVDNNLHAISIGNNDINLNSSNVALGYDTNFYNDTYRSIAIGEGAVVSSFDTSVSNAIQLGTGINTQSNSLQFFIAPIIKAGDIANLETYKLDTNLLIRSLENINAPTLSAKYADSSTYATSATSATYLNGYSLNDILNRVESFYNNVAKDVTELGTGLREDGKNILKNPAGVGLTNIGNNTILNAVDSIVIGQNSILSGESIVNTANNTIVIGNDASAVVDNAVQIGTGLNNVANSFKFNECYIIVKDVNTYKVEPALIKNSLKDLNIVVNELSSNKIITPIINSSDATFTKISTPRLTAAKGTLGNITFDENGFTANDTTGIKVKGGTVNVPNYVGAYAAPDDFTLMRYIDVKWYLEKFGISVAKTAMSLPQEPSIIIGKDAVAASFNVTIAPHGAIRNSKNSILIATPDQNNPLYATTIVDSNNTIQLGKSSSIVSDSGVLRVYDTEVLVAPTDDENNVNTKQFRLSPTILNNIPAELSSEYNANINVAQSNNSLLLDGNTASEILSTAVDNVPLRVINNKIITSQLDEVKDFEGTAEDADIRIGTNSTIENSNKSIVIGNKIFHNSTQSTLIGNELVENTINSNSNITIVNGNNIRVKNSNNSTFINDTAITATNVDNAVIINSNNINDDILSNDVIINNVKILSHENDEYILNKDIVSRSQVHYPLTATLDKNNIIVGKEVSLYDSGTVDDIPVIDNNVIVGNNNEITGTNIIAIGQNNIIENYEIIYSENPNEPYNVEYRVSPSAYQLIAIGNNITYSTDYNNNHKLIIGVSPNAESDADYPIIYNENEDTINANNTEETTDPGSIEFTLFGTNIIENGIINSQLFNNSFSITYNASQLEIKDDADTILNTFTYIPEFAVDYALSTQNVLSAETANFAVSSTSSDIATTSLAAQTATALITTDNDSITFNQLTANAALYKNDKIITVGPNASVVDEYIKDTEVSNAIYIGTSTSVNEKLKNDSINIELDKLDDVPPYIMQYPYNSVYNNNYGYGSLISLSSYTKFTEENDQPIGPTDYRLSYDNVTLNSISISGARGWPEVTNVYQQIVSPYLSIYELVGFVAPSVGSTANEFELSASQLLYLGSSDTAVELLTAATDSEQNIEFTFDDSHIILNKSKAYLYVFTNTNDANLLTAPYDELTSTFVSAALRVGDSTAEFNKILNNPSVDPNVLSAGFLIQNWTFLTNFNVSPNITNNNFININAIDKNISLDNDGLHLINGYNAPSITFNDINIIDTVNNTTILNPDLISSIITHDVENNTIALGGVDTLTNGTIPLDIVSSALIEGFSDSNNIEVYNISAVHSMSADISVSALTSHIAEIANSTESATSAKYAETAISLTEDGLLHIKDQMYVYTPVENSTIVEGETNKFNSIVIGYPITNIEDYDKSNIIISPTAYTPAEDVENSIIIQTNNNTNSIEAAANEFNINGNSIVKNIDSLEDAYIPRNLIKNNDIFTIGKYETGENTTGEGILTAYNINIGPAYANAYVESFTDSIIIGNNDKLSSSDVANSSIAIGNSIDIKTAGGIVIGNNAVVYNSNSIAIGTNASAAPQDNTIQIGSNDLSCNFNVGNLNIIRNGAFNSELLRNNSVNQSDCVTQLDLGNYHIVNGRFDVPTIGNNVSVEITLPPMEELTSIVGSNMSVTEYVNNAILNMNIQTSPRFNGNAWADYVNIEEYDNLSSIVINFKAVKASNYENTNTRVDYSIAYTL